MSPATRSGSASLFYIRFPVQYKRRTTEAAHYPSRQARLVLCEPVRGAPFQYSVSFAFAGRSGG